MARRFLDEDFLLQSEPARRLYHEVAKDLPLIDYHTHLPPQEVAENQRWDNLATLWLGGDHYKWRAMRANGVPERLVTGDGSPREKFQAWAETIPHTLRNPLYHWTHLELQRCFGIDTVLGPDTAEEIWNAANEKLAEPETCAHGYLERFKVDTVGTTDDPADPLVWHEVIATLGINTKVYPTYRPDKALTVDQPAVFNPWCDQLGKIADVEITTIDHLLEALKKRHDEFHALGCRLSDHGMKHCHAEPCSHEVARNIFHKARSHQDVDAAEQDQFAAFIMLHVGQWNAARGWTMQLHLGPQRNVNTRMFQVTGPDAGFDQFGDFSQGERLTAFLDLLARENALPRTILYNLNPNDNQLFAAIAGSFQDDSIPSKVQFGSAWWFNDTKLGMEAQLNALSDIGLLSRFVGMLTDSRSFLSYPRHEYFRRILCNLIGTDVVNGEIPDDHDLLDTLVRGICHDNARNYFAFPHHDT